MSLLLNNHAAFIMIFPKKFMLLFFNIIIDRLIGMAELIQLQHLSILNISALTLCRRACFRNSIWRKFRFINKKGQWKNSLAASISR